MASNGYITTNEVEGRSLTLSWAITSQSVDGNYSDIAWTLYGSGPYTGYVMSGAFYATINGEVVCNSSARIQLRQNTVVASGSQRIYHGSDGAKTFYLYCEAGIYNFAVSATAGAYHALNDIPRASSVSATAAELGSSSTITISRASSAFTHTLTYSFGEIGGSIIIGTSSTTVYWSPSLALANQIPNSTSGYCIINCFTYNNGTYIGCKSCSILLSVPASVKPSIGSLTATRIDGAVPSSWGIYVQSKSKATLNISNAAGTYGSTVKSYSISGGGYSGTAVSLTTGLLNISGNVTFTATVTDSRGRVSDAATVTINVVSYASPYFLEYSNYRSTSSGAASSSGTYVQALIRYGYYGCGGKNTLTRATFYRVVGSTEWINAEASFSSGTAFVFGGGSISPESSYEIKYTITDAFTAISVTDTISTASVVMDFKSGGMGVAVGKVSETDNCFEVSEDWDVKVYGMLPEAYILSIVPKDIVFAECSTAADIQDKIATSADPFTLKKGTVVAVKFTNTNTTAHPRLNINNTGVRYIVGYGNYVPATYAWKPGQTVFFVYDGSFYAGIAISTATASYWGVTMLSSATNSTAQDRSATPYAVKLAYDRNSWDNIYLTNPLAIAYGGTDANNAATARSNLGIHSAWLFSGAVTTRSTYVASGYKFYVVIGQPSSSGSRCAVCIPANVITTSAVGYQFADESYYYSFNVYQSGSYIYFAYRGRSSSGQIVAIFGVN